MKKLEKMESFKSKKLTFEVTTKITGGMQQVTAGGELDMLNTAGGCMYYKSDTIVGTQTIYHNITG